MSLTLGALSTTAVDAIVALCNGGALRAGSAYVCRKLSAALGASSRGAKRRGARETELAAPTEALRPAAPFGSSRGE